MSNDGAASFVHLRVHSAYSLLEGAIRVEDLAGLCRENGMPAVAVTDTNNLFGLFEIAEAVGGAGVQPIVACQLDCALAPATDKPGQGGRGLAKSDLGPLALYAQNADGFANLMKLVSLAYLGVTPGAPPHVGWETLERYSGGLIVLTGGPRGMASRLAAAGQVGAARAILDRLKGIFGDRLYVELQRHGLAEEAAAEPRIIDWA